MFETTIPDWEEILKTALDDWGATADIQFVEVADKGHIWFTAHPMAEGELAHAYPPMATGTTENRHQRGARLPFH